MLTIIRLTIQSRQIYEYLYLGILTNIRVFIHMFHNCDNTIIRVLIPRYTYNYKSCYFSFICLIDYI